MRLSDTVVRAYISGFSGVYVYCDFDKKNRIADKFQEIFEEAWNQALDKVEEEFGNCDQRDNDDENPVTIRMNEKGLFLSIEPLFLTSEDGQRADVDYGTAALENSLQQLQEIFPEIQYEGMIAFDWCDEYDEEVLNYEISSEVMEDDQNKTYPYVKETFDYIFTYFSDLFWESLEEQLEDAEESDYEEVLEDFRTYGVADEQIQRLLALENN